MSMETGLWFKNQFTCQYRYQEEYCGLRVLQARLVSSSFIGDLGEANTGSESLVVPQRFTFLNLMDPPPLHQNFRSKTPVLEL